MVGYGELLKLSMASKATTAYAPDGCSVQGCVTASGLLFKAEAEYFEGRSPKSVTLPESKLPTSLIESFADRHYLLPLHALPRTSSSKSGARERPKKISTLVVGCPLLD